MANDGKRFKKQNGYTLLEYAAGAAVLIAVIYGGLTFMARGMEGLLTSVGNFATRNATAIDAIQPASPGGSAPQPNGSNP